MMLTFSFTINQSTNEAVFTGNISSQQALAILQNIVIAEAIRRAKDGAKESQANTETKEETKASANQKKG